MEHYAKCSAHLYFVDVIIASNYMLIKCVQQLCVHSVHLNVCKCVFMLCVCPTYGRRLHALVKCAKCFWQPLLDNIDKIRHQLLHVYEDV